MAIDTGILVSQVQTKTKQVEVHLTPQKQLSQKVAFQAATQCGTPCPYCQSLGQTGACKLNVGHTGQHECNLVSTHVWSSGTDVPGPH
jgi:hypothetical protein